MSLLRPPRNAAVRTAQFERLIATAPTPKLAYGLAEVWLEHELKHLNVPASLKKEIKERGVYALAALKPGMPGFSERLPALTADVARWAAELAQANGEH